MKTFKHLIALFFILAIVNMAHATTVGDDMTFEGPVAVSGSLTTSGAVTISGSLTTSGTVTMSGSLTTSGTVTSTGAQVLSSTLSVAGVSTLTGGFRVPSEILTATKIVAITDSGKTFYLASATEFAVTLPALSTVPAGTKFKFVISAAPAGADYTIVTGNTAEKLLYGIAVVNGASVAAAADTTVTFTASAAVKGDWVVIESDGTSWYVTGVASAATGITMTGA